MATAPSYLDRRTGPVSPHTPQRGISSSFSSPGTYRAEEDQVIFEFGARNLHVGFAGDSVPRATLAFTAEGSRRVGDYRKWLPGYDELPKQKRRVRDWVADYELWGLDLRDTDIGLIEDKVERIVHEAYSKYLLIDARSRRASVIVPSDVPHPFLSSILSVLFTNFQIPSVTLLHPPTMAVLAAGQRSGIVIDIGWHETAISVVYELREIHRRRTRRAMKVVTIEMARLVHQVNEGESANSTSRHEQEGTGNEIMGIDFESAEDIVTRMAWCKRFSDIASERGSNGLHIPIDVSTESKPTEGEKEETLITIPGASALSGSFQVPFSSLSRPVETALFTSSGSPRDHDDHEQPIYLLLYTALLNLTPDLRSVCMSRIMFSGGGSNIPNLKFRILDELSDLVKRRGWDPVWGRVADDRRRKLKETSYNRRNKAPRPVSLQKFLASGNVSQENEPAIAAAFVAQTPDPIAENLRRESERGSKPTVSGVVRGIETLGSWAGASLASALRIKGAVEVEKDMFLQHGLAGGRREAEAGQTKAKLNYGTGLMRTAGHDAAAWTLGLWA